MKSTKQRTVMSWLTALSLFASLTGGIIVVDSRRALAEKPSKKADKVSSFLREQMRGKKTGESVKAILQLDGQMSGQLNALLRRNGVHHLRNLNTLTLDLSADIIEQLAGFSEVSYVSFDAEVKSFGHVTETTGTEAVRTQKTTTLLGGTTTTTLDGTGIGIAVLDSGIDVQHTSFLDKSNGKRVVLSRDFTGENRTDDPYGHGTHVASTAAGNGRIANGAYTGLAPNAKIINLRVLNTRGAGTVSSVLGALDWVLANRNAFNIRVVNLSLGMPAIDSYRNDPVCKAVRKLADAGLVVVAAAGNNGKTSAGQKIYGAIHSPGIEPSALTVGALNTYGTNSRSDDGVTSYSSRGPTRGFWKDSLGVKHYDNLLKPDLVAPGNKLVYAQAEDNLLVAQNPQLDARVSGSDERKMMYLNGTSMSAPVVAGAAALMLQANPKLTPNMVKALLMYTAQPLAGFNTFEQGAGQLNV